jgi:cytochrome P450
MIERVVPASGFTLPLRIPSQNHTSSSTPENSRTDKVTKESITLPPGTIIGMNPWLIHRNASIFGHNPDSFVPERWLQGPTESTPDFDARIKKMRDADMSFGNGNRTCLGKPLAMVELYKVTATLFGRYKVCSLTQFFVLLCAVWGLGVRVQVLMRV